MTAVNSSRHELHSHATANGFFLILSSGSWRLLPLHASLIFGAPYEVVEALVAANPAAAAAKDDQGMIPLHLSLRNHPVDWRVVEELLAANPGGVGTKDRKGRTPLQGAGTSAKAGTAAGAAPDPALGVLKLYTQIAVARERASILAATTTSAGAAAPVVSTPGAASAAVGSSSTIAPAEAAQNPLDLAGALLDLQRQVEEEREAWKIKVRQVEEAAQTKVEASLRAQAGLREQLDSALQQLENAQEASIDPAFPFSRDNRNECESAEEWKGLCLRLLRQHERALDNSSRLWKAADSHRQESEQLEAEIRCVREEARVLLLTPTTPNTVADAAREQDILAAAASSRSDLDRRRRSRSSGTSKYSSNDHLEEKKDTCRSERQPPLQSGAEPSFSDLPNSVLSTARSEVNSVDHLL
jgi:hypothetical protein